MSVSILQFRQAISVFTPICANVFESLGLGWWEILFHTVNLLVLIIALRFLLYKPIKKLIANHKKKMDDVFEENKKLEKEAVEAKEKYDKMIIEAKEEVAKASVEAADNARIKSEALKRRRNKPKT